MLGATQIMSGRPALVRRGLRSLIAACRHPNYHREFQVLGVASGYLSLQQQGLQRRLPGDGADDPHVPGAARADGVRLEGARHLLRQRAGGRLRRLPADPPGRHPARGVGPVPPPRRARSSTGCAGSTGDDGTCIIGDPPRFPLAYHVLTTALLRLAGRPLPVRRAGAGGAAGAERRRRLVGPDVPAVVDARRLRLPVRARRRPDARRPGDGASDRAPRTAPAPRTSTSTRATAARTPTRSGRRTTG